MATIPRVGELAGPARQSRQIVRVPVVQQDTSVAAAVSDIGREIGEFGRRLQQAKVDKEIVGANRKTREELDRAWREIEEDGSIDPADYETVWKTKSDEIINRNSEMLSAPRGRELWKQQAQDWQFSGTTRSRDLKRRRELEGARADIIAGSADLDRLAGDLAISPETFAQSLNDQRDLIARQQAAGLLSEDAAVEQMAALARIETKDGQSRLANDIEKLARSGDMDAARKLIDERGGDYGDRQQFENIVAGVEREKEAARAEAERQLNEKRDLYAAGLESRLLLGQAGLNDVMDAANKGLVKPTKVPELIRTARSEDDRRRAAADVGNIFAQGGALDPYNPDVRKGVDKLWEQNGGVGAFMETAEAGGGAYSVNRGKALVLQFASEAGVIPPKAASALQGMVVNGTPEQKRTALDTISQLVEINPAAASAAFPDGSDRMFSDAVSWRQKVNAGMNPLQAVAAVEKENEVATDPVLKARKAVADKEMKSLKPDDILKSLDNNWLPFMGKPKFAPGAEEMATAMYREAFSTEMLKSGDPKLAKEQALAQVRRVVGRSRVGGRETVMAYPPEAYYPQSLTKLQPDWTNADIVGAIRETIAGGEEVRASDIQIIPDAMTARQAREGLRPSYVVMWKGDVLDQRFEFDPSSAIDQVNMAAELAQNERLRQAELRDARELETRRAGVVSARDGAADVRARVADSPAVMAINRKYGERAAEIQRKFGATGPGIE